MRSRKRMAIPEHILLAAKYLTVQMYFAIIGANFISYCC